MESREFSTYSGREDWYTEQKRKKVWPNHTACVREKGKGCGVGGD